MTKARSFRFSSPASRWLLPVVAASALALAACSTPAEEATKYYRNGMALLERGELAKARLEFQNALQIVSTMSEATYGLALIAEKQADWERMYALLKRVIDQNPKHVDAQVKLGQLLLAAGQVEEALQVSDAAMALAPESAPVLALRAGVLFRLGDAAAAVSQAKAALEKEPNNIEAIVVLASERQSAGDDTKALELLDQGLARNPGHAPLQLMRAHVLERLEDWRGAERALRELVAANPDTQGYRTLLADLYVRRGMLAEAEAELRGIAAGGDFSAKLALVRFINTHKGYDAAVRELQGLIAAEPDNHQLRFALADLHRHGKNDAAATAVLQEIVAKAGDAADGLKAKGQIAGALLASGDAKRTTVLVEEILAKDPRNEQALFLRAAMAVERRDLDAAIADLRALLRDNPTSARALLLLGKAHELAGAAELADSQYMRAFQVGRMAPQYGVEYAQYLIRRGAFDRAEQVLENVLGVADSDQATLKLLAQVRISRGDWVGAQEVAERIRQLEGQQHVSEQILGAVHAAKKDYDSSIAAFTNAYRAAPNAMQPLVALVRSYVAAGRRDEALRFLGSVLEASPNNANAHLLRGQLHGMNGDRASAAAEFRKAIELDPRLSAGYQNLAALHVREKRYDEALEVVDAGLKALPDDFGLTLTRASLLELTGRYDDAIRLYDDMLVRWPGADIVANNLASLLTEHRSDEASLKRALQLAARFERSAIPHFKDTLAWANFKAGRHQAAVAMLEEIAEQVPDHPVFRYHLGMGYLKLANAEAAKRELQKALELAENAPFAYSEQVRAALASL